MTELESICEYALYPEIRAFDDARSLVRDPSTGQLYYKKVLSVYSLSVFSWLKEHPHPNIPAVYAYWEQDGKLTVIEEYIRGKTLEAVLEQGGISFAERKRILLAVCDGLSHLHHADPPIVHRDVKASNVMVAEDGAVKLIDYDAAKVYQGEAGRDTVLIGTQGIAAPEQYGFAESDGRTDIYALGKLTERMFSDDAVAEIVKKATHLDPQDRYQDVEQMRAKVEKLREGGGRHGAVFTAVIAAAAVLVTAVLLWLLCRGCGTAAADASQEARTDTQTADVTTAPAEDRAETGTDEALQTEAAETEETETEPAQGSTADETETDGNWRAELSLKPDADLGDMQGLRVEAALTDGPAAQKTHVRFEIDAAVLGEHLSFITEETFSAGQTAAVMFAVPVEALNAQTAADAADTADAADVTDGDTKADGAESDTKADGAESEDDGAGTVPAFVIEAYSDDGTLMGQYAGTAE